MTRNLRQEALCRAFIHAIAARAGMSVSLPNADFGIDMTLSDIINLNGHFLESGTKIDVQAKSVVQREGVIDSVRYDLDIRAYNALRLTSVAVPRILVVLVLPQDERDWSSQSEDELVLRRCAYWLSLKARPPVANRRSIRVTIPRRNVFSAAGLHGMIDRLKRGEEP
jgi:hypothetical protein